MSEPRISLDVSGTENALPGAELDAKAARVAEIAADLEARRGPGAEYLGWLDLPERIGEADYAAYDDLAERAGQDAEFFVVIGIGGSYLGSRAAIEAPDTGSARRSSPGCSTRCATARSASA
jgi:glucose-6-phosphate isomerase